MSIDLLTLLKDSTKTFGLDEAKLRDITFAICMSDVLHGSNGRELDIDNITRDDLDLDWSSILGWLGIQATMQTKGDLPRVHKLRLISDVLSLSVSNKVNDLVLCNPESNRVAKLLGVSLPCVDYADEPTCYKNLEKINAYITSNSLNLDKLDAVYKKLCIYSNKILEIGSFNIPSEIENILIPDSIFKTLGKKCSISSLSKFLAQNSMSIDNYCDYVVDIYCYNIVQEVAKMLNTRYKNNEVAFNLILTRLSSFAGSYLPIGTYSLNGYTQRLSVLRNVPSYLSRKVNIVFSESTAFSEMSIQGCICVLHCIRKMNIRKDEFVNEMEGLVNECRK